KNLWRITLRVDGDEKRLDRIRLVAQRLQRICHDAKLCRADIRAEGETKIEKQIAAAPALIAHHLAQRIGEGEWPAHTRLPCGGDLTGACALTTFDDEGNPYADDNGDNDAEYESDLAIACHMVVSIA